MKQCRHCGAIQDNKHFYCIDCGEKLDSPLSKEEEAQVDKKISKLINKLANRSDYFHVTRLDKVIALLLALGAAAFLILFLFNRSIYIENQFGLLIFLGIILMVIEAVDIAFPRVFWEIYKLKFAFQLSNPEDMVPSEIALFFRRVYGYAVFIAGYGALIYNIIYLVVR